MPVNSLYPPDAFFTVPCPKMVEIICMPSGSYQERTRELGSFGMSHHPRGYVSNFLVLEWIAYPLT